MAINRDKVLEAAQKFVDRKKYDKAVAELQKLILADPNDARTLLKIGDLQQKQGLHAEAISTYESVGRLYAHQGFALKAIAVFKQIREIIAKYVPHLEERYGHIAPQLAELYQQLGLTSDALAALDEVATRLQRQQRDREAIEIFGKIVQLDPTNPLPHLRLAEALSRVRDVDGAVYEFRTAAAQLAGIGRRDDALKVLERLLHHRPDPEQAKIAAELYLSRGQPQDGMQALAKLQICFQANPRDFDTLSLLARAFNAIGQGAKAIEVQKEMARVARDTGKTDLFREIVERLQRVAPYDEGVKKLAGQLGAQPSMGLAGGPSGSYPHAPPAAAPHVAPAPAPAPEPSPAPPAYGADAFGRPVTQPLHRPRPPQPMEEPEAEAIEELEEISYEEVEAEAIIEDEDYADAALAEEDFDDYEDGGTYEISPDDQTPQEAGYGEPYASSEQPYTATPDFAENESVVTADGGHDAAGLDRHHPAAYLEPGTDATEHIQKVLADATAFRRVRLYARALETLRGGLEIDPRSMDLHEVYRDVLLEDGQTEEAVQEMLVIATLFVDALDGESAARALQDVLAYDPENGRAIEMLQELGYEIVDENDEAVPYGDNGGYAESPPHEVALPDEAHHRLPSYDLEEMGAADVGEHYADDRQVYVRGGGQGEGDLAYGDAGSLPSFPLEEPATENVYAETGELDPGHEPMPPHPSAEPPPPVATSSVAPATGSIGPAASMDLEDALDEAEFFCSRGLYDDARAILAEQLGRHPNHPLLAERMAELDAHQQARGAGGSGAREKPREQDRAFDIAASLDALESLDDYAKPAEGFASEGEQIDVEEVFAKFKEGVAAQISVDDSDSHYNLGIAYKEMMLLDDAIREFDMAARDPNRECVCRSMIGMIHIERGNLNEAIEAFLQGLNADIKEPTQETVLCFEIGAAYEAKKMSKEALTYYQKTMRRDPNYRDVQERVRRLAKQEPKTPLRQVAVGADDEFDRAFDDLLSKA